MRAVESSVSAWATQAQLNGAFGVAAKSTGFHHVERLKRMPTGMPGSQPFWRCCEAERRPRRLHRLAESGLVGASSSRM